MRTLNRKNEKNNQKPFCPFLSSKKVKEIKDKLKKLKDVSRPKLSEEVSRLAELGDFSENVEYQLAKWKLRRINAKILILENQLKQAKVIKTPKQFNTIQIGHKVVVKVGRNKKTYKILGSSEANPIKGIISYSSPIGHALLKHKINDLVKIKPVDKEIEYTILEIK
jgi:transcription elongation factor GreA